MFVICSASLYLCVLLVLCFDQFCFCVCGLWMQEMQLDSEEWFSHEHVRLVRISLRREGEDVMTLSFSNTSFRERVFSIVYTVRGGGSTTLCFISDRVCFGGSTFG